MTTTQFLVTGDFVKDQLLEIETKDGFTRLRSLQHALLQLTEDLEATTADWSQWDATWQFATGALPRYAADNLNAKSLQQLRLSFLIIADQHGRPVFAKSVSGDGVHLLEPPADIVAMAAGTGPLSGASDPLRKLTGLIAATDDMYLVSSQPVLLSSANGPPRGRMIMGRSVTSIIIPRLRRITAEAPGLSPALIDDVARSLTLRRDGNEALALSNDTLHGFTQLTDVWGRPAGSLQLQMTRPTQVMLAHGRQYLLITTLGVGVIFCAIALFIARISLIRPIERLSAAVEQIGKGGQTDARIPVEAMAREFRTLALAINDMLQQVGQQQEMRRDRDAAVEANRLKSEFLATMSHEIRTPMNGVLGMCELLQRTDLTPRQRHLSDTVVRSARSLLGILNDVLDFSKIESGRLDLECAPFSPAEIVQTASAPFLAAAQAKGLHFIVRMDTATPALILGDALRLRQIVNNLLSNAIKFTEQGSVSIACSATPLDRSRVELRLTVADTGIGIAAMAQQHIFDPFTQAAVNTSRVYGGTGLGLAIVRRLATLMGGEVQLHSEAGRGSQFIVTAVMRRATDQQTLRGSLAEATGPRFSIAHAPQILLAEDNAVNREVFTEMLEHFGCRVTAVENGALAVAAVADRSFDAILMDCQMPVMDGQTATTELRMLERATAQKPALIIALTADATPENHQRCLEAGMDAVVTKPITHSSLREVIMRAMRRPAPSPA
ncbi:ATP-binding protein [Povalibacter sp.]|uniref:ATP-binding protein n=1 Tax=Povalibacter sp. TaxID=1962978 RepID=UPI002F3FD743